MGYLLPSKQVGGDSIILSVSPSGTLLCEFVDNKDVEKNCNCST